MSADKTLIKFNEFVTEAVANGASARGRAIDLVCSRVWHPELANLSEATAKRLAQASGLPWQACALPKKFAVTGNGGYVQLQAALNAKVRELAEETPGKPVGMEVFAALWKDLIDPPKQKTPEQRLRAAVAAYAKAVSDGAGCVATDDLAECLEILTDIHDSSMGSPGTATTREGVELQ